MIRLTTGKALFLTAVCLLIPVAGCETQLPGPNEGIPEGEFPDTPTTKEHGTPPATREVTLAVTGMA